MHRGPDNSLEAALVEEMNDDGDGDGGCPRAEEERGEEAESEDWDNVWH